jgi:hypothetical protein
MYFNNFNPVKASAILKPDRIKPKFGDSAVTFHMNMRRFMPVSCVKEEPIWA